MIVRREAQSEMNIEEELPYKFTKSSQNGFNVLRAGINLIQDLSLSVRITCDPEVAQSEMTILQASGVSSA